MPKIWAKSVWLWGEKNRRKKTTKLWSLRDEKQHRAFHMEFLLTRPLWSFPRTALMLYKDEILSDCWTPSVTSCLLQKWNHGHVILYDFGYISDLTSSGVPLLQAILYGGPSVETIPSRTFSSTSAWLFSISPCSESY